MSHFWAPSACVPPDKGPRLFGLRRRWSELELLSARGRYQVTQEDAQEESPPVARRAGTLASLCAGRRRVRTEGVADLRAKARFRTRSSPEQNTPVYHVTATLLSDQMRDHAVLTIRRRSDAGLSTPRTRTSSTSTVYQLYPVSSTHPAPSWQFTSDILDVRLGYY